MKKEILRAIGLVGMSMLLAGALTSCSVVKPNTVCYGGYKG